MKKSIWIFLLAVLLPSVVLGWLALHSAEEQQIILEKRTAELYQKETENAADAVRAVLDSERRGFAEAVGHLLASKNPREAAVDFSADLARTWPRKAVGFALGKDGRLLSPSAQKTRDNAEWQKFLLNNSAFLCSTMPATVYWVSGEELSRPEPLRRTKYGNESQAALGAAQSALNTNAAAKLGQRDNSTPVNNEAPERETAKTILPDGKITQYDGAGSKAPNPSAAISAAPAARDAPAPAPKGPFPAAPMPSEPALVLPIAPMPVLGSLSHAEPEKKKTAPADAAKDSSLEKRSTGIEEGRRTDPEPKERKSEANNREDLLEKATAAPQQEAPVDRLARQDAAVRNVAPQRVPEGNGVVLSQIMPSTADFKALTAEGHDGVITRFVQDQLEILFWLRPAQAPEMIFGCQIEAENLRDLWPSALPAPEAGSYRDPLSGRGSPEFVLALLDDKTKPVTTQPPGETGRDWKRPFVASEIGEALPHWEAALYLQRPEQLRDSARALRRTLTFLIAAALGAIACGGWLVVADARRQLALAQQKTDFVSNVSHELKTPLTSIRMFAELMQNGRAETAGKHPQYLRIIMVEAERLTRLINNVLDFAGLERKQKRFDKKPHDLHAVVERIWEGHELHLRESGFTTRWQSAPPPYPVIGDEDALAQILVNLLSNAEKYAGDRKEVELHTYLDGGRVCVSVLDRGMGVPPGEGRKIFEAFYRAHDSLSSGIQGSGLGLTLARRLAQEHGGEILYQAREGGGSNFTLCLPMAPQAPGIPAPR